MIRRSILLASAAVLAAAAPAAAQGAWVGRTRVSVNVAAQTGTERLSEAFSLERYAEPSLVTARLPRRVVPVLDGGAAVRLADRIGIGLAVSYLSDTDDATVMASIPHPFYFDQPREISGTATIRHSELATHVDVVYLIGTPRLAVALAAGPSFVSVDQDLVTDVAFSESYPFETASYSGATVQGVSESKVGYNVSADISWHVSSRWGVGGLLRFTRARVGLTLPSGLEAGERNLGGLQVGGGLRLFF